MTHAQTYGIPYLKFHIRLVVECDGLRQECGAWEDLRWCMRFTSDRYDPPMVDSLYRTKENRLSRA